MSTAPSFDPIARAATQWRSRWGEDSPALAMAAATSVMRVQQLLLARFDAVLAPHRLTFARYEALVLLTFSSSGALPMSKIGERLMIHPTSATNIVQRLASDGYVDRVPNPRDGRGTLARVTDEGRRVVEEATQQLHAIGFGVQALERSEQAGLIELLGHIRADAGDQVQFDNY